LRFGDCEEKSRSRSVRPSLPPPQRRQLRVGDKAVLVCIQLVEERGGEFVAAEFAVFVGVALLEGAAGAASAGLN
jgi:hypothetical protein